MKRIKKSLFEIFNKNCSFVLFFCLPPAPRPFNWGTPFFVPQSFSSPASLFKIFVCLSLFCFVRVSIQRWRGEKSPPSFLLWPPPVFLPFPSPQRGRGGAGFADPQSGVFFAKQKRAGVASLYATLLCKSKVAYKPMASPLCGSAKPRKTEPSPNQRLGGSKDGKTSGGRRDKKDPIKDWGKGEDEKKRPGQFLQKCKTKSSFGEEGISITETMLMYDRIIV